MSQLKNLSVDQAVAVENASVTKLQVKMNVIVSLVSAAHTAKLAHVLKSHVPTMEIARSKTARSSANVRNASKDHAAKEIHAKMLTVISHVVGVNVKMGLPDAVASQGILVKTVKKIHVKAKIHVSQHTFVNQSVRVDPYVYHDITNMIVQLGTPYNSNVKSTHVYYNPLRSLLRRKI